MVRLDEHKHHTEHAPIERMAALAKAYIPLSQHVGKMCVPDVKVGDVVARGQRIGSAAAQVYAVVHASISGKVAAVQDWPHPALGMCKVVVIDSDGQDREQAAGRRDQAAVDALSPDEARAIILEAGIVGMGGAGFPSHIKLNPPKPVDSLVINGAECEPYLTCDARLMVEKAVQIAAGIRAVARCLNVKDVYIAVEDNKPEAIAAMSEAARDEGYHIKILPSRYPQGGEKQLVKSVLGREIPRGKLPFEIGVVVHNVATVYAIYEALYLGKPLYERVVTVTGSCVGQPKNLLARVGTPIKELIAACGPLKEAPAKIVCGGPMMGVAQCADDVPVTKLMSGLVVLNADEARGLDEEPCIRCGACVRECPVGLMPCLINLASGKQMWLETKAYDAADCIECGICSYVCPANRRLTPSIKRAKIEINR